MELLEDLESIFNFHKIFNALQVKLNEWNDVSKLIMKGNNMIYFIPQTD